MRERGKLPVMVRLAAVQRAQRASAEAQLAVARSAEAAARIAEDEALEGSRAAERQWLDHVRAPGFSPEYGLALSGRLIGREEDAQKAASQARQAGELCASRQGEWQRQEARVRLSEASLRRLKRQVERRTEENRMAELADRVTYAWSRP
jgi:hypothetical protein